MKKSALVSPTRFLCALLKIARLFCIFLQSKKQNFYITGNTRFVDMQNSSVTANFSGVFFFFSIISFRLAINMGYGTKKIGAHTRTPTVYSVFILFTIPLQKRCQKILVTLTARAFQRTVHNGALGQNERDFFTEFRAQILNELLHAAV